MDSAPFSWQLIGIVETKTLGFKNGLKFGKIVKQEGTENRNHSTKASEKEIGRNTLVSDMQYLKPPTRLKNLEAPVNQARRPIAHICSECGDWEQNTTGS